MDITYTQDGVKFNYRVAGIILNGHKILAMQDERAPYYYLPGGRVMLGETAEEAIIREIKEELELEASIIRPLWLNQAFFRQDIDQIKYHELCLYFLIQIKDSRLLQRGGKFSLNEGDHLHRFAWLDLASLPDLYFYPLFLKQEIFNLPEVFTLRTEIEE